MTMPTRLWTGWWGRASLL